MGVKLRRKTCQDIGNAAWSGFNEAFEVNVTGSIFVLRCSNSPERDLTNFRAAFYLSSSKKSKYAFANSSGFSNAILCPDRITTPLTFVATYNQTLLQKEPFVRTCSICRRGTSPKKKS